LDLLELESSQDTLSYPRRLSLLLKRIQSILTRLIAKFQEMRNKHKAYAKVNREMWGKQIDLLQQQTDDLVANLEDVMEQTKFYMTVYKQHTDQLQRLLNQQKNSLDAFRAAQSEIREAGVAFNSETRLRASQLRKLQEVTHYLLFPNQTYNEAVFAFACDGVVAGNAIEDSCSVCGGANTTCLDCSGVANGIAELDVCGVCGGQGKSCNYFCAGGANSGQLLDLCGECNGDGSFCVGCDNVPNSGVVLDSCGVCGGDSSSCSTDGTPEPVLTAVASSTEVLYISKIRLIDAKFTPEWTAKYGTVFRKLIASLVTAPENIALEKVLLINTVAEGSDNALASIGLLMPAQSSVDIAAELTKALSEDSISNALLQTSIATQARVVVAPKQLQNIGSH